MNCPKCENSRTLLNTEGYRHNYDLGTLVDEYWSYASCAVCGKEFLVKLVYNTLSETKIEGEQ